MARVMAAEEGTPLYDSVAIERAEGIPALGLPVPRHPDIYRELVTEWGHDVLAEIPSTAWREARRAQQQG